MNKAFQTGWIVILLMVSNLVFSDEPCSDKSGTQKDLNGCEAANLASAHAQLQFLLVKIQKIYESDSIFLAKLSASQEQWQRSFEADIELKYPTEQRTGYGSVFPMCYNGYATSLVVSRIEFLKHWERGVVEGEVCSGTAMSSWRIQEMDAKVEK